MLLGCATLAPPEPQTECGPPRFPYRDGWLGGDAAYSIPLAESRSLWLFGDSFVGPPDASRRDGEDVAFIHNSIAISECRRGRGYEIAYAWGTAPDGTPRAFFDTGGETYWWLFDGFLHADRLYIGLLRVETAEPRGLLGLPFHLKGVQLARVANWREPPNRWRSEILALSESKVAFPASAMEVHGGHVYLFTFVDRGDGPESRVLARLPLDALDQTPPRLPERLEYLARDGRWKPGLDVEDARVLMDDGSSEMSVHFHPGPSRWVALYGSPEPSGRVWLRSAARLEGPWSAPIAVYRIPELAAEHRDPNTFCYAAKEQPQFESAGTLVFTYVCNLFTRPGEDPAEVLNRLLEQPDLYRPRAVELPYPALPP